VAAGPLKKKPGEVVEVPVSAASGRFTASDSQLSELIKNGQIAAQYAVEGKAAQEYPFNPTGSALAAESITSADGRILGRMGSFERFGRDLYKNYGGRFDMKIFESGVKYFT
jgi:phosphoribosylformylglycinamidine synthase